MLEVKEATDLDHPSPFRWLCKSVTTIGAHGCNEPQTMTATATLTVIVVSGIIGISTAYHLSCALKENSPVISLLVSFDLHKKPTEQFDGRNGGTKVPW